MSQTRPEQEGIQLALREIAEAREHLRLAGDALSAAATTEAREGSAARRLARAAAAGD